VAIVNPPASGALREIELPCGRLREGNGRGVPMRRYSMIDSTLLLVAVQTVIIAALMPLSLTPKLIAIACSLAFTLVAAVISHRRSRHTKAVRNERAAIIRWLAIHSTLDHQGRLALAWAEPQEIGERQYEFRTVCNGLLLSLVIDLDIQVASLATL
jgi:hypothetical protein